MEGTDLIRNFIDRSDEEKQIAQQAFDGAQETSGGQPIAVSGRYRMRVVTRCYRNKTNEWTQYPTLKEAKKKGSLMLNMLMEVVDGTAEVPKGSTAFHAITILPKKGADEKLVANTFNMSKPQLITLLNVKSGDIKIFDSAWFESNLLPKFEISGDVATLVHDHKLKQEVMVNLVDTINPTTAKAEVRTNGMIVPAGANDHSISNKLVAGAASTGFSHVDPSGVTDQREDF